MANKDITLHPQTDGVLDTNINIYPKTKLHNIVEDDGETPVGIQRTLTVNPSSSDILKLEGNELHIDTGALMFMILDKIFPVGSIYTSTRADINSPNDILDPSGAYGFGWTRIEERFLYAAKDSSTLFKVNSEGGSADAIVPQHTHVITAQYSNAKTVGTDKALIGTFYTSRGDYNHANICLPDGSLKGSNGIVTIQEGYQPGSGWGYNPPDLQEVMMRNNSSQNTNGISINAEHQHTLPSINAEASTEGESVTNANLPPYLCVKMWKRTN